MKSKLIAILLLFLGCVGCKVRSPKSPDRPVVIVFENDVHCAVDGYAKLVALKEQQQLETPYVTTVSCGDFVQGDLIGSISKGENIVTIMNEVNMLVLSVLLPTRPG